MLTIVFNAFFLYLLIWWTALFAVLPMGVERNTDDGKGHDAGAPKIANLKRKLVLNSLISAVILAIIYILGYTGVLDLKAISQGGL